MKLGQKLAILYISTKLKILNIFSPKKAVQETFKIFSTPPTRSNKPASAIFKKAEKHSIMVDDIEVILFHWPKAGAQKITILHGFESSITNFDNYINQLIGRGFEVVAADAPGHGISGGKQLTLPLYIKTIEAIDQQFGPITGFVSHSFGGLALAHFMENKPNNQDKKLVFIAPATEVTTAIDNFFDLLNLKGSIRTSFEAHIKELGKQPIEYFSVKRTMANIQSRVLWIHDREDKVTPLKDIEPLIENKTDNIEFVITKGLGHSRIYRDETVMKKVISFF